MKIIFDELATEKIKSFGAVDLALDFNHTLSETNTEVDACAGGISRWRLVAVDKGTTPEHLMGKWNLSLVPFISRLGQDFLG